ncbi:AAA family ATPase [Kocuria marina]|uniref:AAA family ATPase n=2 Tax=Micrococcaceae TaxID=1268 RepID=UPI0022E960E5|nr:AAA family ATPase [Kocuria marina]
MTLANDLATWVAERTDWQKDIVGRFCRNENLSEDAVNEIADHLIAGTYPSVAAITAADVPGTSESGESVRLSAVADVEGVNALITGQRLTFASTGLTIIYGDNASGKSGYARLIRQAVTARVKGDLLGDVFAKSLHDQKAVFEYVAGSTAATWALTEETSRDLSSVRFYDEECGDAYVTAASEISYRPSALTLLDRLSAACDQVRQALSQRLSDNAALRTELPLLGEGTKAKQFLDQLSATTTREQIDEATTLSPDHDISLSAKLRELTRLQASDPNAEKTRLAQLAAHWATVKSHIDQLAEDVTNQSFDNVAALAKSAINLREAAKIASAKDFDAEPLPGVGSATWRALWDAARRYSTTEAYHEHDFPVTTDAAVCVLCQQPLSPDGSDRLRRFDAFIKDTTSRDADAAERRVVQRRDEIARLQSAPAAVTTALSQLQAGGEDVTASQTWMTEAATVATEIVAWVDGTREERPTTSGMSPGTAIGERRQTLITASADIDSTSFNESVRVLKAEVADLQATEQLAKAKDNLVKEVVRLQARTKIEEARRLTDTTGITRKATALTTAYVTSIVRDQFTRETEQLYLRRVTLDPTKGRRDVTLEHRPRLLGAILDADIENVLSEGEQTALGLAGFLTEVEFDESKSAVVLDDPVSSLDAGRRSRVARRLTELAQSRQVIVFTHEATFANALNKAARDLGVDVAERAILRQGERPGLTADKHPWSVKDIPARINHLETEIARLKKERGQLDSDEYTRRAQEWGGRLSQAWERAVNLDVVNELVDRGTNEVRPRMFKMLVGITEQDDNDYQSGYAKASEWAPRHDHAPETNFIAPEPDELEAELVRFKEWVRRIKGYKK